MVMNNTGEMTDSSEDASFASHSLLKNAIASPSPATWSAAAERRCAASDASGPVAYQFQWVLFFLFYSGMYGMYLLYFCMRKKKGIFFFPPNLAMAGFFGGGDTYRFDVLSINPNGQRFSVLPMRSCHPRMLSPSGWPDLQIRP
jgi:hypothetical protein